MKYKITIEYLGTNLSGWQKQPNHKLSVQQIIEDAISKLTGEYNIEVVGAGRTDKGVHACAQIAHFEINSQIACYKLRHSLNHFIGSQDVFITNCVEIEDKFHARFSAKERHYLYKIFNRDSRSIFCSNLHYWIKSPLCLEKMRHASRFFLGTHNFEGFRSSDCQSRSPIKTINNISIISPNEHNIEIYISAKSFLHKMVRKIVGTIVRVGQDRLELNKVQELIFSQDRSSTGPTAPAHGLYLWKVDY